MQAAEIHHHNEQLGCYQVSVGHEITMVKFGDQAPNHGRLLNISETGLGIIAKRAVTKGAVVRVFTLTKSFLAQVQWCRMGNNGGKIYFRLGLREVISSKG